MEKFTYGNEVEIGGMLPAEEMDTDERKWDYDRKNNEKKIKALLLKKKVIVKHEEKK